MVLLGLIRYLRGWVRFRVVGRFPERFINVALKSGIGIFDNTASNNAELNTKTILKLDAKAVLVYVDNGFLMLEIYKEKQ